MTDQLDIFAQGLAGKSRASGAVQGSMQVGMDFDPDEYAKSMRLAAQHKIEPAAVLNDPVHYDRLNKADEAVSLVGSHPKTAAWLSMPDHAAIGQDDIPNLRQIESHFTGSTTGLSQSQWQAVLEDRARVTQENFKRSEGGSLLANTNAALSAIPSLGYRVLGTALAYPEAGFRALGDALWNYQNQSIPDLIRKMGSEYAKAGEEGSLSGTLRAVPDKAQAQIAQSKKSGPTPMLIDPKTKQPFKNPDYSTWAGRGLVDTLESAPGQLATFVAGGESTPIIMALDSAHAKQRAALDEMQATHPDTPLVLEEHAKALAEGWSSGLLNYAVMGLLPAPAATQTVKGAVAQGTGRAVLLGTGLTAFENTISKLHDPERPVFQGWEQGLTGMALWEGLGTYHQIRQVRENLKMLDGLEDLTKSSKLNARMQEKFQELVKANADGTGNEHVMVPADAFTSYFQSMGQDPAAVAATLQVPNFSEATLSGTDIRIPVEVWATKMANTHHAESLIRDVRFQPDQFTLREMQDKLAKAKKPRPAIVNPEQTELEKFTAQRKAQLEAAGFAPDTAKAQAEWHAKVFDTLAGSENLTVDQMHEMFPLNITGVQAGEGNKSVLDVALSRMKLFGSGLKEYAQAVMGLAGDDGKPKLNNGVQDGTDRGAEGSTAGREAGGNPALSGLGEGSAETGAHRGSRIPGAASTEAAHDLRAPDPNNFLKENQAYLDSGQPLAGKKELAGAQVETQHIYADWSPDGRILQVFPHALFREALDGRLKLYDLPSVILELSNDGKSVLIENSNQGAVPSEIKTTQMVQEALSAFHAEYPEAEWVFGNLVGGEAIHAWRARFPSTRFGEVEPYPTGPRKVGSIVPNSPNPEEPIPGSRPVVTHISDFLVDRRVDDTTYNQRMEALGYKARRPIDLSRSSDPSILFQDDRRARAREKMRRALSPSGQGAELNRRTAEAKAQEAEFSAFDLAVKELQAGDILSDKRGFIQITPDRKFHIGLLEGRDLSTFLHESGHYFLEVMGDLAERPEASERIKTMWADTLKNLGVEDRKGIQKEHHEKFAQQMERYMMEGKAPSAELKPVFQRFKSWLMLVYKQLDVLGAKLNDHVRSVFDRMMATDAEIQAQKSKTPDMFLTAEEMGVSPEEFRIYTEARAGQVADAHDKVGSQTLRDLQREQESAYRSEEEQTRAQVAVGVDSRPDVKAMAALQDPGGEVKLDRAAVDAQFGNHDGIPTVERGGMDADTAAELLGYSSGAKLIEALKAAPDRDALVDGLTKEIMVGKYGDVLLDGSLADKVQDALANDKAAEVKMAELRALRGLQRVVEKVGRAKERADRQDQRAADARIPTINEVREQVRAMVDGMTLRDLNPYAYQIAADKYSRIAYEEKGKGNYAEAADAKQKEILNHFLDRDARKAKDEGAKIRQEAREGFRKDFQSMLGLAGPSFQSAYNELLRGYEFDNLSGVKLDSRREALTHLQEIHEQDGIDLDPVLLKGVPRNYREVPMTELRAVRDALRNIETVARAQREMDVNGQKVAFEHIRMLFMTQTPDAERSVIHRENDKLTMGEKAGRFVRGLDATLLKVEWMVDRFDRGDINGPMRTFIKKIIDDANGRKLELGADIFGRIKTLVESQGKENLKHELDSTGIQFPSQVEDMTRQQLKTWVLNLGTAENRNVALNGEGLINGDSSLSPLVDQALSKLTAADCRFIQGVWDILEVLRPLIREKELRVKGIEPKWKENTPFTVHTADGQTVQMRGGYFPLAADRNTEDIGKNQSDPLAVMGEGSRSRVKVAEGFTQQVTGATYRLRLNYPAVLSEHLNDVITNITCGEAVSAVNRVISDPAIRLAMEEKLGPEYVATLKPWLVDFVERAQDAPRPDALANGITRFRSGMVVAKLAGNIPSMVGQASDIFKPLFAPGVSNLELMKAYVDMARHPKELVAQIKELSPNEMRHRDQTFNREIRDALTSKSLFEQKRYSTAAFLMEGFRAMDAVVTFPTWLAVYRKGMKDHGNESQAIMEADRIIARTFQAGDPRNMSSLFRNRNVWARLFTTFQNDGNTWYGIISSSVASKDVARVSGALMGAFVSQAVFQLLKNRGPGIKKDEKEWLIEQAILTPVGSLPFLGDALASGLIPGGRAGDVTSSAMGQTIAAAAKPFRHFEDMDAQEMVMSELEAVGPWAGVSMTSQSLRSWKYVHKVQKGEERPTGIADATINTIFGKNPNE